jgi:hypothetical protein
MLEQKRAAVPRVLVRETLRFDPICPSPLHRAPPLLTPLAPQQCNISLPDFADEIDEKSWLGRATTRVQYSMSRLGAAGDAKDGPIDCVRGAQQEEGQR